MAKLSVDQALLKAKSHIKKGEIEEAQQVYNDVLQAFPKNKRAQQGLAALDKPKQLAASKGPLQDIIKQLLNLYNQGQLEAVVEQAKALTLHHPEAFVVWNILGAAAAQTRQRDQAIDAFKRVIAIKPDYAEAHNNMGIVLKDQGKLEEAIASYNKALSLKPDYAEAHNNMGIALKDQGKLEEAIASYNKALSLKLDFAEAHNNMGIVLKDQGKLEEAIASYNKALSLKLDYAEAYNNIGTALQDQGKLEEAMASYNKALSLKPDYADAARNLVKLPIGCIDEQTISELNNQFSLIYASIDDQSQKLFFEANLFSHKGMYDEAFKTFCDANYIRANKNIFSIKSEQKQLDTAINRIRKWSFNLQSEEKAPIKKLFLLGPSRSGKSYLEAILIGSPNVYPMFEGINLEAMDKRDRSMEENKNPSMFDLFYHDENSLLKLGYNVVTSTRPDTIFHIDRLNGLLNNSFCIFVKRNPKDIASEIFTKEYRKGHFYSYDHSSILKYLDTYEITWEIIKQKLPHLTLEISFEDISSKPLKTIEKISRMTGVSLEVSKPPNRSITNLPSPFREHYASHFMDP